jgi:HEPN domain-containing protein
MKPLDPEVERLLGQWLAKADADLEAAERLAPEVADSLRLREIVGFHCQQAVEKYLKALLTRHQVDFPKTHDIQQLVALVRAVAQNAADEMRGAEWLTPFGVEIRYPSDAAEMLPGDEVKAIEIARRVKKVVTGMFTGE